MGIERFLSDMIYMKSELLLWFRNRNLICSLISYVHRTIINFKDGKLELFYDNYHAEGVKLLYLSFFDSLLFFYLCSSLLLLSLLLCRVFVFHIIHYVYYRTYTYCRTSRGLNIRVISWKHQFTRTCAKTEIQNLLFLTCV